MISGNAHTLFVLAEILALASGLFLLNVLLFFSPGLLLLERQIADVSLRAFAAVGVSVLFWAALSVISLLLPDEARHLILLALGVSLITLGYSRRTWRALEADPTMRRAAYLWFFYYLIAVLIACFPAAGLASVSYGNSMRLTGLAVDNLIPYNVSRFLIERLDPRTLEVVPTWSFIDRGPLAGLLNASLFLLLGLRDGGHWLESSGIHFFVFQCLMAFLNASIVPTLYLVATRRSGHRAALFSVLLFATTYFALVNTFYSWPKWLMCSFLLGGLELWRCRHYRSAGVVLGLAVLSHDAAWLTLLPLGVAVILRALVWQSKRVVARSGQAEVQVAPLALSERGLTRGELLQFALTFSLVLGPWFIAKTVLAPAHPSQLAALQLFCVPDSRGLEGRSTWELAENYLRTTPLRDLLRVRLDNLIFPVDPSYVWRSFVVDGPGAALHQVAVHSFKVFWLAVGPLLIPLVVVAVFSRGRRVYAQYVPHIVGGGGAYLMASLLLGCPFSSVNHHWAYLAFCAVMLLAGTTLSLWGAAGVALGLLLGASNLLFVRTSFLAGAPASIWTSAEPVYYLVVILLGALFLYQLSKRHRPYDLADNPPPGNLGSGRRFALALATVCGLVLALVAAVSAGERRERAAVASPEDNRAVARILNYRLVESVNLPEGMRTTEPLVTYRSAQELHLVPALPLLAGAERLFRADFNGDDAPDLAIFYTRAIGDFDRMPRNWKLFLSRSENAHRASTEWRFSVRTLAWGLPGDQPFVGDYNADGRDDLVMLTPATFRWNVLFSADPGRIVSALSAEPRAGLQLQWGLPGDRAISGNFDTRRGDEFGVYRPSTGEWLFAQLNLAATNNSRPLRFEFGGADGSAFGLDLDGDGTLEPGLAFPDTGRWLLRSANKGVKSVLWDRVKDDAFTVSIPLAVDTIAKGSAALAVWDGALRSVRVAVVGNSPEFPGSVVSGSVPDVSIRFDTNIEPEQMALLAVFPPQS